MKYITIFEPLFDWINAELNLKVNFEIKYNGKRPEIISPDLRDKSGIFSAVFREVAVGIFNFGETDNGFWGTVSIQYKSWSGGSNGSLIGTFWYTDGGTWEFQTCKDRTLKFESGIL